MAIKCKLNNYHSESTSVITVSLHCGKRQADASEDSSMHEQEKAAASRAANTPFSLSDTSIYKGKIPTLFIY